MTDIRLYIHDRELFFHDSEAIRTYPEDLSKIFNWMKILNLSERPIILDVGANLGVFSLAYRSMFVDCEVHAFEPIEFIYHQLSQNIKLNGQTKFIKTYNFGMSDEAEVIELSIPTPEQHERYKLPTDVRHFSIHGQGVEKFTGNLMVLDTWFEESALTKVDLIKIDVEGYELPVLEGASKTIKKHKPNIIFELNDLGIELSGTPPERFLEFAQSHDYETYGLEYGYKTELLPIHSVEQIPLISDIILLPKS